METSVRLSPKAIALERATLAYFLSPQGQEAMDET
jgi:hypothetical protein